MASPPGGGPRAVIRLSGPDALAIARRAFAPFPARPGVDWREGHLQSSPFDFEIPAHAYVMPAPRSYTTEHVVELHVPGAVPVAEHVVDVLGTRSPLPVEVMRMGHRRLPRVLAELGCAPALRLGDDDRPFVSDNGNHIYDCRFDAIHRPHELEAEINNVIGVVENGLFLDMATRVVVATTSGVVVKER